MNESRKMLLVSTLGCRSLFEIAAPNRAASLGDIRNTAVGTSAIG